MSEDAELTALDIAKMFGVDERTVYRWERDGLLPKRATESGHARWRRADVETVRGRQTTPGIY